MELKNHRPIVQFSDNLYLSFRMRHAVLEALSLTALHRFRSLNYVISFGKRHLEDVLDAAHRAALEYVIRTIPQAVNLLNSVPSTPGESFTPFKSTV